MDFNVYIPDEIAARLSGTSTDISRRALEALALEEYRNGHITDAELMILLGFQTRYELDGFLKAHGVCDNFTIEDFERDLADLKSLGW